jgi:anti-sigma regulatory factor (Ser/Thr protein kinase)
MTDGRIELHFDVDGASFESAGGASESLKMRLKQIGVPADVIRRVTIAMYEAEINMVIHAGGGVADAVIESDKVEIVLKDKGPGIESIERAMQEGFSTATENIRNLGFGAGMGLPNMKKYADSLRVESEVGKGTTVTITVNL